jgi:hypothetical protein
MDLLERQESCAWMEGVRSIIALLFFRAGIFNHLAVMLGCHAGFCVTLGGNIIGAVWTLDFAKPCWLITPGYRVHGFAMKVIATKKDKQTSGKTGVLIPYIPKGSYHRFLPPAFIYRRLVLPSLWWSSYLITHSYGRPIILRPALLFGPFGDKIPTDL